MSELFGAIAASVRDGDQGKTVDLVRDATVAGIPAPKILSEGLIPGMQQLGLLSKDGQAFLPQILISARAMTMGLNELGPHLSRHAAAEKGTVVLGTVEGDLHEIGKNLAGMVLAGNGFTVIDLGVDVSAAAFVQATQGHAADIVALSALLTTTTPEFRRVVEALDAADICARVRATVGGGAPVSQALADGIGADGFAEDCRDGRGRSRAADQPEGEGMMRFTKQRFREICQGKRLGDFGILGHGSRFCSAVSPGRPICAISPPPGRHKTIVGVASTGGTHQGFLGGKRPRPASRGRRQPDKTMVAVAAEQTRGGGLGRACLCVVGDANADSPSTAARATIAVGSVVQTDGWTGYADLKRAGYGRRPRRLPTGAEIDYWLPWSHIVLSNIKRWTLDIFHGVSAAHLQAYLDEYCYRLNRREQCEDLFRRVLNRCVLYTDPAPYSLLTGT